MNENHAGKMHEFFIITSDDVQRALKAAANNEPAAQMPSV